MNEDHRGGSPDGGGSARETASEEKAGYATQVTKREGLAEPPLEQPGRQNGLPGIPGAIEYRGEKSSVAHKASSDSADHHTDHEGCTGARPKRDQDPRGEA
jgi:hypothetical protein